MSIKIYLASAVAGAFIGFGAAWAYPKDEVPMAIFITNHNSCVETLEELELDDAQGKAAAYGLCMAGHYTKLAEKILEDNSEEF